LLAAALTDVPGSSAYFERGFITYSNIAKQEVLGVRFETLEKFGAVSVEVAKEMAEGALKNSHAQIGVAITGIAGPDGGTKEKPIGSVCIAWAHLGLLTKTAKVHFDGDRTAIRMQTVKFALEGLL
jgi:nicotinamide-nucleotide amidase